MNIDRLVTMYRAAKQRQRLFFQDVYQATITSSIKGRIPNPDFKDVYVFSTSYQRHTQHMAFPRPISFKGISKHRFVMGVRVSMLRYLRSLTKFMSFKDGLLIYSLWEGYKQQIEMKTFLKTCEELGLKVVSCHTSGHADEKAIEELIQRCNPKTVVPVHTLNVEWFDKVKHCKNKATQTNVQ